MQGIYTIDGVDFAKYNPEIDWTGKHFNQYPEVVNLKNRVGVYVFTLCGEPVYIGSSTNIFGRLQTHIAHMKSKTNQQSSKLKWKKYYYLNKYVSHVQFQVLDIYSNNITKEELEEHEYKYIYEYHPIFNVNYKNTLYRWNGTEQDVDDFVNGIISMNILKTHQNDYENGDDEI
jgi:excinuclease UvrABC nuclease subunit